jgi:DNA primase
VSTFETLREQIPLDRIIQPNGRGKVHCVAPDHPDANPSMHVYDTHVHCFSCRFHGDVTDVWAAKHGFERPVEAALDLAREYGVKLPEMSPEAQVKAQERRKKEDLYLQQARACHEALSLHESVTGWWEKRGFGEELRNRHLLGANKSGTMAVIPFWNRGRVKGLIRRKLQDEPKKYLYPNAEDFPEGHRPLFIPGPVRAGAYLVEGIIDALALAASGESAVAIGGTGVSREQLRELERLPGPLYILPDADEEGAVAARQWIRHLYPKALLCPSEYGREAEDA